MAGSKNEIKILEFKTVFLGDPAVGKTALANRFMRKEFKSTYAPDLTLDILIPSITYQQKIVKHKLIISPGKNSGQTVLYKSYYTNPNPDAVVLIFDLTNQDSFNNLSQHLDYIKKLISTSDFSLILVGNKSDLVARRVVSDADIIRFQNTHNATYIQTSAQDDEKKEELAQHVTKTIYNRKIMTKKKPYQSRDNYFLSAGGTNSGEPLIQPTSKRSVLELKLFNYISRIEGNLDVNKNIDYRQGFWFFARQRGNNRRVNYRLATDLLRALRNSPDSIDTIFSNLEDKRKTIIKTLKLGPNDFIAQGINSSELNGIINEAHKAGLNANSEERSLLDNSGL